MKENDLKALRSACECLSSTIRLTMRCCLEFACDNQEQFEQWMKEKIERGKKK